ncbi:MAG TPA: TonB family protein [Gemmatimonadaceae bacterium]|nr:TonB family protein [Gemmatimonadaceae bacterium]
MFNTLLESKPKKERTLGQALVSTVVHTALIALAVYATAQAGQQVLDKPKEEKVEFAEVKPEEPPPPEEKPPPPPDVTVAPPPPKGFQVLTAPVNIPDVIPDIDLTKKVTDEADFSGKGVAGGVARGVEGGTGPVDTDQPYFEFQVEKVAAQAPGSVAPAYPEMLRSAGVEGTVLAQFVVNTEGKAEPETFKVLKSDHEMFTQAVRNTLPRMKFYPAEVGGRKVKQLVQQPFVFKLAK